MEVLRIQHWRKQQLTVARVSSCLACALGRDRCNAAVTSAREFESAQIRINPGNVPKGGRAQE